jgi:hypothetical protein
MPQQGATRVPNGVRKRPAGRPAGRSLNAWLAQSVMASLISVLLPFSSGAYIDDARAGRTLNAPVQQRPDTRAR